MSREMNAVFFRWSNNCLVEEIIISFALLAVLILKNHKILLALFAAQVQCWFMSRLLSNKTHTSTENCYNVDMMLNHLSIKDFFVDKTIHEKHAPCIHYYEEQPRQHTKCVEKYFFFSCKIIHIQN